MVVSIYFFLTNVVRELGHCFEGLQKTGGTCLKPRYCGHRQSNLWKTGADYDQETSTVIKSSLKGGDSFLQMPSKENCKDLFEFFLVFSFKI